MHERGRENGKDLFLSTHVLWHLRCCYCFVHLNLFVTVCREFYDEDFMISLVVSKNQKFDLLAFISSSSLVVFYSCSLIFEI